MNSALNKTCSHALSESFCAQVLRLKRAGYPPELITAVCESLLQNIKRPKANDKPNKADMPVKVIPYIHQVSHNIKRIARKHNVQVVFSAPCKLSKLCALTNSKKRRVCVTQHRNKFTMCVFNVVYSIPLSCGRRYIGQTGRCFNERAREHNLNVRNQTGGFLGEHCKRCGCTPDFQRTQFLKKAKDKTEREIMEAFFIHKAGDNCVSRPSIVLSDAEIDYLKGFI